MASLSNHDVAHIHDIMAGEGTWFSAELLRLLRKADQPTLAQFEVAFPNHVALFRWWWAHRSDDAPPLELVESS